MMMQKQNLAILGSTGSIGCSTLEVVEHAPTRFSVLALSAHSNTARVLEQAHRFRPRWLVAVDESTAGAFGPSALPAGTELLTGPDALVQVAESPEVDTVVSAIVGSAGLRSTLAAITAGKRVALANKETMVVAGALVNQHLRQSGGMLLPIDSEHSAVFQAMAAGRRDDVQRIVLTASGGPFREHRADQLASVTVEQALDHPTWDMGPKITIDSATMMNKALEIIEARWLFDLEPEQIDVVIHPQSIVHSMVEFVDGSMVAQLSPPDMRMPIQYALSYPERWQGPAERLDLTKGLSLDFFPPDMERFPAIPLGLEVARAGGTAGAVVNAANEAAVEKFLNGQLQFTEIVPASQAVLDNHQFDPNPTVDDLMSIDVWAREEIHKWACTS